MLLERFICDKGEGKQQNERPSYENVGASEVKYQIGGQKSPEEKLKNVHIPKMRFGRIFLIAEASFPQMNQYDKNPHYKYVPDDPQILPECIHPFERKRVENESKYE